MPELAHPLRRDPEQRRDADELRQRLRLQLVELGDPARLDELAQARVDSRADPGQLARAPGAHERGHVGRGRADQVGRAPVRAHGVVPRSVQVEQGGEGVEPFRERGVVHRLESGRMTQIVIPFRGAHGKQRLDAPNEVRAELGLAMLGDVVAAATVTGRTLVVTDDEAGRTLAVELGAGLVADTRGGQAAAVAAALAELDEGTVLVVNADLPCVVPHDLRTLAGAAELGAIGYVEAEDGTTNALALPGKEHFAPLYGGGSAARFRDHADSDRRPGDLLRDPEPRGRCRHARRPAPARAPRRPAHTGRDRPHAPAVKVVLLSGGVGGARFARGLVDAAGGANLTIIGNVGDDLEVLGMSVSPDLDSILYALSGLHDEERGWGRAGETWEALGTVSALGGEDWFRLGDRDLGLQLVRTQALRAGEPLSAVTARLARALGIEAAILPATDDRLRTWIDTPAGSFEFQEWFVARGHRDEVDGVRFVGDARPAPGVLAATDAAEAILIAPSNPYVSIWPILAVPEIRAALEARRVPAVAVSPLVGGRAVKGPADRMLARMAGGTTPEHVAGCYAGLIDALVVDESDPTGPSAVRRVVTKTLMTDLDASRRLAETALEAAA